jgi:putative exporter of polyketide antibiotics
MIDSMGVIKYVTNNWRIKLVCLLTATVIWYVIDYNVSPKRDVRALRTTTGLVDPGFSKQGTKTQFSEVPGEGATGKEGNP